MNVITLSLLLLVDISINKYPSFKRCRTFWVTFLHCRGVVDIDPSQAPFSRGESQYWERRLLAPRSERGNRFTFLLLGPSEFQDEERRRLFFHSSFASSPRELSKREFASERVPLGELLLSSLILFKTFDLSWSWVHNGEFLSLAVSTNAPLHRAYVPMLRNRI